ncbi:MAG TPA: diguanylate cyclase, partial [Solirubrobacteraceae bacterium]|nr:diguanylate cyclase [Solirubrobacteraceae bacterium]
WEARARARASRRELIVEAAAGALFLAAWAGLLVAQGAAQPLDPAAVGLLVVLYVLVARVEFPVGTGHVLPTQLVLVPMLVLLPPAVVPGVVAAGLVAATAIDWALRRVPARRLVSAVPDAWHALGAAVVLVAAGSPVIDFHAVPLMAGAFAACCFIDFVSSLLRMRLAGIVPDITVQARVMLSVWAIDACLAPLGFAVAVSTEHGLGAVLLVAPLALLLWLLARDRHRRIEQAHHRLKLLEHERGRLQSAVRRLGDAFAAKLELDSLLEILLHGAIHSVDAAAGRLELDGLATPVRLHAGAHNATATLSLPVVIAVDPVPVTGTLHLVRDGRAFDAAELELLEELTAKAGHAASEILANQAVREQAVTDALTGLGNRRRLTADLAATLESTVDRTPTLLLMFDLDGFKSYNDTFGHLAGDQLLTRLGAKLSEAVAAHGTAYRLGGDEFCALLKVDGEELDDLIARAAAALTDTGKQFAVRASFGAVLMPHEADSPDHALQLADERMYAHKRGRTEGPRDQARDVLLRTMHAKQPELNEHSSEVAQLAVLVARQLGLTGEQLDEVARAAELHDVGKVGIPDAILNKPGPLDPTEWEFMYQHTILGERILNAAPALRPVARLVRSSHERWDGTGYPDKLAGEDIPLGARIVAVCDAYEAMTADRPYRRALSEHAAREQLSANAGTQFDPAVVAAFLIAAAPDQAAPDDDANRTAVDATAAHIRALLTRADRVIRSA